MFGTETLTFRGGVAACDGARLLVSTTVFAAKWRCTTACVGGAAIKLTCSISTMLAAKTTRICKGGATFHRAHFRAATTMPTAPSFCCRCGSSRAFTERAEPKGTVFAAESASFGSCTTSISRAALLVSSMWCTKPSCYSVVAAAFSRAGHFVSGMLVADLASLVCVGFTPVRCADPVRTVLGADG